MAALETKNDGNYKFEVWQARQDSEATRFDKIRTGASFNICLSTVEDIINLAKYPTEEEANAIQIALGEAGEYLDVLELWPAGFERFCCEPGEIPGET